MSSPNFANIMEQIAFRIKLFQATEVFTSTASTGYVALEGSALADLEGDYQTACTAGIDSDRDTLASVLDGSNVRSALEPFIQQVGQTLLSNAGDTDQIMLDLYDYMVTNSQSVNSRAFTLGGVSAGGSNVGTGNLIRLTVDESATATIMEGWFSDVFTATCVQDSRQSGVTFEEVFRLRGRNIVKDELARTNSGLDELVRCSSERDSERYIKNPGFEVLGGTQPSTGSEVAPTSIDGWTVTTNLSNFLGSSDIVYRTPPGGSTSFSLKFVGNDTITQNLVTVNGTRFDPDTPMFVAVPIYRKDSATGNVVITLGATTRTVTLASLNNAAWNLVPIVATPDKSLYYKNFKQNSLSFSIAVNTLAVGTCYVDAIHCFPFQLVGGGSRIGRGAMGQYFVMYSGVTPFVQLKDTFTFTDTDATRGTNQYWLAMAGLGYLPHNNAAGETIADK